MVFELSAGATESSQDRAESVRRAGRTLARLARQVELGVAVAELSLSQYRVLMILDSGHQAASGLADKLAVSRPSITGVVDGLVARGLVCRNPDDADRRRVDVRLTPAGATALGAAEAEVTRRLTAIAEHMDPEAGDPFSTLAPWRSALHAHREAQHGCR